MRKLSLGLVLLFTTLAWAAPKVDALGACTDASVPDAVKKALATAGYKVSLDDGSTVSLWPAAQVTSAKKTRDDATYALTPGSFVGVVIFDKDHKDYRGNLIKAGTYTLRYEIQPSDGDHLGTSPTPDFPLLSPIAADANPAAAYNFDDLVAMSRQATGKKHPAPMNLTPPDAKQYPSVATDNEEHTILSFKAKSAAGEVPMALVVKGTTTE